MIINNHYLDQVIEICSNKLDSYYARLYALTRDELRYTPYGLNPKEVHNDDFPGGTVCVVE